MKEATIFGQRFRWTMCSGESPGTWSVPLCSKELFVQYDEKNIFTEPGAP